MQPPFRADHVGSLLRPAGLAKARKKKDETFQQGAIRAVVAKQEAIGLRGEIEKWSRAVKESGAKAD